MCGVNQVRVRQRAGGRASALSLSPSHIAVGAALHPRPSARQTKRARAAERACAQEPNRARADEDDFRSAYERTRRRQVTSSKQLIHILTPTTHV